MKNTMTMTELSFMNKDGKNEKVNDDPDGVSKNMLIMDKALEEEFNKTLEVFDLYVQTMAIIDTTSLSNNIMKGEIAYKKDK